MDEEGLERMCKKVSQLTRVIYLINTKNDDNQALIESLIASYDNELDSIRRQAKDALSVMKAKMDKLQDTKGPEEKVKEIKRSYENSLLAFAETQKKFKEEVEKKEGRIHKDYQDKCERMIKQVNDMKRNTEKAIADRDKQDNEERDKLLKSFSLEKERMNKEFDMKRAALEQKIAQTAAEVKEQLDQLTVDHNRYIAIIKEEFEKKLKEKDRLLLQATASQSQLIEEAKKRYEEQLKAFSEENSNTKAKIADYEKEMSSLTNKLNGFEVEIQSLRKAKEDLEAKLSKNANISLEEKNRIQKEIEDLKQLLFNEKAKSEEKSTKLKSFESLLLTKDALIAQLTNDNNALKKDRGVELNRKNEIINELKERITELNKALFEKGNEASSMKDTIDKLTIEVKELKEQISTLNSSLSQSNQSADQTILDLKNQLLANERDFKKKNDELVAYYDNKLNVLSIEAKQREERLNYEHSNELNALRDAFDKEKLSIETQMANDKKALMSRIKELTEALSDSSQSSTSTITAFEQKVKSLEASLAASSHSLDQLKNQLTSQAASHEKELTALKEAYNEQLRQLQDKLSKAQQIGSETSKDLNKAISNLKADHQREIALLESNHREEVDRLKYQHSLSSNEVRLKYDKEISELKIRIAGMEAEFIKSQKSINDSLNKLIKEQQVEIDELKRRSLSDLAVMKAQCEEKIASMQKNADKALIEKLTQLEAGYEEKVKQLTRELSELKAKHSAEIAQVFNDNKKIIDDYEKKFKAETKALNKTIADLNSSAVSLEIQIDTLTQTKAAQEETLAKLSEENSVMRSQIQSFNEKIATAEKEAREAKEIYEKLKEQLTKEYEEKNKLIEKSLAERTKVFKDFHVGEFDKIKAEFFETLQLLEKKNANLIGELEDLKAFIAKRPSREEDVDEINSLREELERKDREYEETTALLDQFRSELLNREESYNGYFDRKPKVGYVNPLKDKGDKQKASNKPTSKPKALNMSGNTPNNFPKLIK